mmetsp:Transcript_48012/g.155407  ORF Transcript_48012/g.155407 Transcript_48012/m.155407 type:complete len:647 (+) Transcript_48012:199-2139(+)
MRPMRGSRVVRARVSRARRGAAPPPSPARGRSVLGAGADGREGEGRPLLAVAVVELVLELDPLEAEGVQEGGEVLHRHEHDERDDGPHRKGDEGRDRREGRVLDARLEPGAEDHVLEELRQLRVRERERPQAEVRRRVGDAAEHKLDRVDALVNEGVAGREGVAVVLGLVVVLVEVVVLVARVLVDLDERDRQQQDRHRDEGGEEELELDVGLQRRDADLVLARQHRARVLVDRRRAQQVDKVTRRDGRAARHRAGGGEGGVDAVPRLRHAGAVGVAGPAEALDAVERDGDVGGGRHEHVDQEREERRRRLADAPFGGGQAGLRGGVVEGAGPVRGPLHEDGEDEVAEDAAEEGHLGDELEEDLLDVLVLEVVEQREVDAKRHLQHADHDRDLHLERVEEGDLVLRHVPDRVDADGVDWPAELAPLEVLARHAREPLLLEALPARRAEEAHREGERLVVEQADEGAEEAVQEADVPASIDHLEHVAQVLALPLLLLGDEPVAEAGEEQAVPEVAEHDAEEVREEDAAKGARVHLAVPRRAVGVDERLEAAGEGVGRDVRRRRELGLDEVDDGARVEPLRHGGGLEGGDQRLVLIRRHPSLGDEDGALKVELALVEGVVHHLLARDDVRPRAVRCGERGEGAAKDRR